eukprot:tig00000852_g5044.t1
MVFYFTTIDPQYTIYMGKDKYENEELIRHGWPEDIWFHVDKMSSAHVYIRMPKGKTINDVPPEVIEDCAQLVKQNSIQGCKENNVSIVYTPWSNLKKTGGMDVGQVGFHSDKLVKTVKVEKKKAEIVNRLEKTRVEREPDLAAEREARDRAERAEKKEAMRQKQKEDLELAAERRKLAEQKEYTFLKEDKMHTNKEKEAKSIEDVRAIEEDFM